MNSILSATSQRDSVAPDMLKHFQQFKTNFRGDPKQVVMNMLQNGQITNPQLQQAMQMAKQLQGILK